MSVVREGKGCSLRVLCQLLGKTRQGYYGRESLAEREAIRAELVIGRVTEIRRVQKRIGVRKLHHMLKSFFDEHGIEMGRDALYDLLREHSLLVRKRQVRKPRTTVSLWWRRYPNLIREFVPMAANQLWVSDITYVRAGSGFAYLSLITDAYSRMIVGYKLARNLSARAGCLAALRMALRNNPKTQESSALIHHSDRGLQYCSSEYVKQLGTRRIRISMTQKSDPLENAIAERVNGILKEELLEEDGFESFAQARERIDEAVSTYNNLRPHLSIDMLTPAEAHTRTGTLKQHWKNYFSTRPNAQASA